MKFNRYTWNLYKQSPDGQKAIKEFEEASENLSEFDLMFKYNPRLKLWDDNKKRRSFIEDFMESMWCYNISEFPDEPTPQTLKEAKEKRTLDTEKEGSLLFKPDKSTIKGVAYIFENNEMTAAGVAVNTFSALEATDFLIERYLVIGAGSGDIVGLMLNDFPNKATMSIAMSIESSYVLVTYMPYEKTKSRGISKEDIIKTKMIELFANK